MKLDTSKYKLSLFTEDVCEDCTKVKKILQENNIPFFNKSITRDGTKEKDNNRWDYIDAEREQTLPWYTPVLIIEDISGNITYIPSVQDKSKFEEGSCMEEVEEVLEVLKPYSI
tara:strand:+ start:27 stop:368 length:342 start_codon:yes stop_codon:yes gene_type:complete